MTSKDDYEVGYGRPPEQTRFQKSQSGNPKGRPKGSRSVSAIIAAALAEKVVITENGRRKSISKLEAAFKQLANKAAGGDRHAAKLAIDILHQSEVRDEARAAGVPVSAEIRAASDLAILAAIRERAVVAPPPPPDDGHDD